MGLFMVWLAGDHHTAPAEMVSAPTAEEAAAVGAARLFDARNPLEALDVFVASATTDRRRRSFAVRFRVLADITRMRYDGDQATIEGVEFVPTRHVMPDESTKARK